MLLKSSIFMLSLLISLTSASNEFKKNAKLFLVGGGLKTCSSMSLNQCLSDDFLSSNDKTQPLYQVSTENIDLLFEFWPDDRLAQQKSALKRLLKKMSRANNRVLTKSQLRKLWLAQGGKTLMNQLADREFYLMLDALEMGLVNEQDFRRTERVSLANTKNQFSRELFERFTQLATEKAQLKQELKQEQKQKPRILVVTASARDPFEAVDFYTDVFTQAGADVTWLPIDAALNALWQNHGKQAKTCQQLESYQAEKLSTIKRKFIYPDHYLNQLKWCQAPERFIKAINQADGLFINGGDQSLTRQAFKNNDGSDNQLLTAIRKQLKNNQLIVGGSSAGTAVMSGGRYQNQPIPMITNGRSETALIRGAKANVVPSAGCQKDNQCGAVLNDDLTYNSLGGLGLFNWGIMDTHFSERGRQGRLVRLVEDTQSRFAFGVDEATALVVAWENPNDVVMQVAGQTGVFIVERNSSKRQNKITTYYPTRDDHIRLKNGELSIDFADWKQPQLSEATLQQMDDVFAGDNYRKAAAKFCQSTAKLQSLSSAYGGNDISLKLTKADNWQQAFGVLNTSTGDKPYCSYQNVHFNYQVD